MADRCDILTVASAETETLLRALARLPDLDWTVTIVGDADVATEAKLGERVRRARDLGPCLADADCFVHAAGDGEPSQALIAALRHGLPVALITGPGAPALPAEASVMVGRGAADDLSKALRRIVFDAALRARMAAAAAAYGATLASVGEA